MRIATVHGAKGTEAPVVYLPDTMTAPRSAAQLVWSPDGGMVLWPVRKENRDPLSERWIEAARARDREEYRRLLYVAMTRAEDRLIVCGWKGGRKSNETPWRAMVENAFDALSDATGDRGDVRALRCAQTAPPDRVGAAAEDAAVDPVSPAWMRRPARAETATAARRPSRAGPVLSPEAEARGRWLHSLMQAWPAVPKRRRKTTARWRRRRWRMCSITRLSPRSSGRKASLKRRWRRRGGCRAASTVWR